MNRMLTLVVLVCSVSTLQAADPFAGEIEDGSWAKFRVTVTGDSIDLDLETTIKAVGRTQELGEDCQWIEIGSVDTASGERLEVFKVLFREKDLKRGHVSISEAVRAWMLPRDSEQPMQAGGVELGGLALLFPGELDDEQRAEQRETVDLQGESLDCAVLEGKSKAELGTQTITVSHRTLLHDDVPFGLAGFRKEVQFGQSDQSIVATGELLETGTDAESLLPNSL